MVFQQIKKAGLTLCAIAATSLYPQHAEAIIGTSCTRMKREVYYETYVVQDGDNLWTIADKAYGSRRMYDPLTERSRHLPTELAKTNGIVSPYYIKKDQKLSVPHERIVFVESDVCSVAGPDFFGIIL